MTGLIVTKDYQSFVDAAMIDKYNEIYDFFQVASGNVEGCSEFVVEQCIGSKDILIIRPYFNKALRLTPKAADYLPKWIENHLMDGMDAESFWGIEHAKENDAWEEQKSV